MQELNPWDVQTVVRCLPNPVREFLELHPGQVTLAGGFIRDVIARNQPSDIDLWVPSKEIGERLSGELALIIPLQGFSNRIETDNAFTVIGFPYPVQFIYKWTAERAEVFEKFDFTACKAAMWCLRSTDGPHWSGKCDDLFYEDLAAKRLRYDSSSTDTNVATSVIRLLKFYERGYRIGVDDLGKLLGAFCQSALGSESMTAKLTAMLQDAVSPGSKSKDPNVPAGNYR